MNTKNRIEKYEDDSQRDNNVKNQITRVFELRFIPTVSLRLLAKYILVALIILGSFGLLPQLPAVMLSLILMLRFVYAEFSHGQLNKQAYGVIIVLVSLAHFVFLYYLVSSKNSETPDLSLQFAYSRTQQRLMLTIHNNNPSAVAESPQIGGVYFYKTGPTEYNEDRVHIEDQLPPFVHDESVQLYGQYFYHDNTPESRWYRHYIHYILTCKTCPDKKEYWVGLSETSWVSRFVKPSTFVSDSLISDPPDKFIDGMIPKENRQPIPIVK